MRFNIDDLNDGYMSWASFSLGCRFSNNFIIPTAGISLFPVVMAMYEEYFPSHFIDLTMGYDLDGEEPMMGAAYSWILTHIGAYGSFLIGMYDSSYFSAAAGPVFRLTSDNSILDLQLYGGPAYIYDEFGGDFGLRFSWDYDSDVSLFDFSIGCQVSHSHIIPTVSIGVGLALILGWIMPVAVYVDE